MDKERLSVKISDASQGRVVRTGKGWRLVSRFRKKRRRQIGVGKNSKTLAVSPSRAGGTSVGKKEKDGLAKENKFREVSGEFPREERQG